jgi:hypothetical protein
MVVWNTLTAAIRRKLLDADVIVVADSKLKIVCADLK